ncbi:MAG: hypothetical protein K8I29_19620 [Alphaproteobacteria bacterium]|uniref:DUF7192 domain-containing protein n=1 Tax=Candidatus Nitrobium versatile TaxID=2884831 RepID=A0A953SI35_9BACT|nr:hypothetical protein [Candidatus Nitrobium versatile]
MQLTKEGKLNIITFDSTEDIFRYIQDVPETNFSKRYPVNKDWCAMTFAEAEKCLISGWPEGSEVIALIADVLESKMEIEAGISYNYDVTGECIDVGAYLEGVPECWLAAVPEERQKPSLEIIVNCSISSGVKESKIINRGAVITALIDALHRHYALKVNFVERCNGEHENGFNRENLRIELPVDTRNGYSRDMIAFLTACPAYLRRILFAVTEKVFKKDHCHGYGTPTTYKKEGAIVFTCMNSVEMEANGEDYYSPEAAVQTLKSKLAGHVVFAE